MSTVALNSSIYIKDHRDRHIKISKQNFQYQTMYSQGNIQPNQNIQPRGNNMQPGNMQPVNPQQTSHQQLRPVNMRPQGNMRPQINIQAGNMPAGNMQRPGSTQLSISNVHTVQQLTNAQQMGNGQVSQVQIMPNNQHQMYTAPYQAGQNYLYYNGQQGIKLPVSSQVNPGMCNIVSAPQSMAQLTTQQIRPRQLTAQQMRAQMIAPQMHPQQIQNIAAQTISRMPQQQALAPHRSVVPQARSLQSILSQPQITESPQPINILDAPDNGMLSPDNGLLNPGSNNVLLNQETASVAQIFDSLIDDFTKEFQ